MGIIKSVPNSGLVLIIFFVDSRTNVDRHYSALCGGCLALFGNVHKVVINHV